MYPQLKWVLFLFKCDSVLSYLYEMVFWYKSVDGLARPGSSLACLVIGQSMHFSGMSGWIMSIQGPGDELCSGYIPLYPGELGIMVQVRSNSST